MNKMKTIAHSLLFSTASIALTAAFDNSGGSWKKDADGNLELNADGNPIYIGGTGQEMTIEPNTISRLNAEAKSHREAKETAEAALKPFEGLDPVAAKKAIEDMKDVNLANMVEKGELDRVKEEITNQFTSSLAEKDKALEGANGTIDSLRLDRAFDTSAFISENITIPKYIRHEYGDRFKVVDGKVIPHGGDGNPLMSKSRIGEIATFDEAIETYIENDPAKDNFLKPSNEGGSGNDGNGGNRGKGRVIKRSDFDAMSPAERSATVEAVNKGEAQFAE